MIVPWKQTDSHMITSACFLWKNQLKVWDPPSESMVGGNGHQKFEKYNL